MIKCVGKVPFCKSGPKYSQFLDHHHLLFLGMLKAILEVAVGQLERSDVYSAIANCKLQCIKKCASPLPPSFPPSPKIVNDDILTTFFHLGFLGAAYSSKLCCSGVDNNPTV